MCAIKLFIASWDRRMIDGGEGGGGRRGESVDAAATGRIYMNRSILPQHPDAGVDAVI